MGVEYAHGLFVADLMWKPEWAHVDRIHKVLVKWKLATKKPVYQELGGMKPKKLAEAAAKKQLPANLGLDYGEVSGAPVVALMGESQYGLEADERYIQEVSVVLGVDFRILNCETYEIAVTTPPKDGKVEVEVDEFASGVTGSMSYPASWTTTPPKTTAPGKFTGVWRSGLILDCGKDLPALSEECSDALPAKGFRGELEKAFGTKLIEQGWIH